MGEPRVGVSREAIEDAADCLRRDVGMPDVPLQVVIDETIRAATR
jgi:hypothetical protein